MHRPTCTQVFILSLPENTSTRIFASWMSDTATVMPLNRNSTYIGLTLWYINILLICTDDNYILVRVQDGTSPLFRIEVFICDWFVVNQLFSQNGLKETDRNANKDFSGEIFSEACHWNHPLGNSPQISEFSQACCLPEGLLVTQRQWKSPLFLPDPWYQPSPWMIRICLNFEIFRELLTVTLQSSVTFRFWDLLILLWESTMKGNSMDICQIVSYFFPTVLHLLVFTSRQMNISKN